MFAFQRSGLVFGGCPESFRGWRLFGVWCLVFGVFLWCLGFGVSHASAWNYETPFEFVGEGDFDGDGNTDVLILDKVTGAFRIGYQTALGDPAWADTRASGIEGVTGVSIGRVLNTARDTLVATAPAANRVNLVEIASAASPALPVSMFIPSLGPNLVSAIDIGGAGNTAHADLYVVSQDNPGPRETLMRNTGASRSLIADVGLANYRSSANTFQVKAATTKLGLMNRNAPANDQFLMLDLGSGATVANLTFTVPLAPTSPPQFVAERFGSSPYAQVLFHRAGDASLMKFQIDEPVANTFTMMGSNSFALGAPIQQVQVLARPGTPRLLVLFGSAPTNATIATVYDFDGTNAPIAVQSFTNANGFTAGAALGGNFTLLSSDGSGRSTSYQNWLASGNGYVAGTSGTLPKVTPYSGGANVVMFAGEPFVELNAKALRSVKARDWSSAPVLSGGAPPTVTVSAEKFLNASNGLTGPSAVALGTAPAGTTHALVNQYTNPISIFTQRSAIGDEPANVTITPPAGEYPSSIQLTLTVNTAGWSARYRFGAGASWTPYSGPITLYSNATIQFYAFQLFGTGRTPMQSASYTFTEPVSTLDSDHDGVPDYVEVAKGLDPRGGADSDGDGFTDLEELVRNTLANVGTNHPPTNLPRLQTTAGFDRVVAPFAVNHPGGGNAYSSNRTEMRVFNLAGDLLGSAQTTNITTPIVRTSAAVISNLVVPPGEKLVVEATPANFDVITGNADKRIGRELIGLIPLPAISNIVVPFTYTGGVVNVAVSNWIFAASNLYTTLNRPKVVGDLFVEDTLVAALFEQKVRELLLVRGTNSATNMTLYPFRPDDVGRESYSLETLKTIECYISPAAPGFNEATLRTHFNTVKSSPMAEHVALRQAAREIYRLSAELHNSNAPAYGPPYAELRRLVSGEAISADYGAQPSLSGLLANAFLGASNLLATAPPRPTTNVTLEVVSLSPSNEPTFQLLGTLTPVTLWRKDGRPCILPQGFDLLPGSRVSVFGHTDIDPGVGGFPIEVITLSLASVPIASDGDANGDLLIDTWQNAFFGGGFGDAFADDDGDGYSNVQEMLSGSDPNNGFSVPSVAPAPFAQPMIVFQAQFGGGQLSFEFNWPAAYVNDFNFGLRQGSDVEGPYMNLPVGAPVALGGDRFAFNVMLPAVQKQFFYLTVALRP